MTYLVVFYEYSSILSSMSNEQTVKYEIHDGKIAIITLFRPQSANALNSQMALELKDILENIQSSAGTVILTGAGEKAFCAGADLKERNSMNITDWQIQHLLFRQVLQLIMKCPIPVIAAVNGAAYGGGLELALGCDFIYAARNAHFSLPEATLGIMPGIGGIQNLIRAVGIRRAKELLFTGKSFTGEEAYEWGMVNKLCKPDSLINEALSCAKTISGNAPLAVKAIKKSAHHDEKLFNETLSFESGQYKLLLSTNDRIEGITAYNEKRMANFTGS